MLNQKVFDDLINRPEIKDWALKDQMNRSAGSVMDNIAEGYGRGGNREFVQFLSYALGSLNELESQIYRSIDRKYIDENRSIEFEMAIKNLKGMIISFLNYLRNTDKKGPKYKD